jgi:hypothetical protein
VKHIYARLAPAIVTAIRAARPRLAGLKVRCTPALVADVDEICARPVFVSTGDKPRVHRLTQLAAAIGYAGPLFESRPEVRG